MPEKAADRGWKIWSVAFTAAIVIGVFWIVENRSQPPQPPPVTLPYDPPGVPGR